MKETRFNIGMNTLKQIDGLHGEEVYNTIQEISPAIADLLVELFGDIYTRPNLDFKERELIRTTRKTGGLLTGYKPVVLGQRLKALAFTTFKPHSH